MAPLIRSFSIHPLKHHISLPLFFLTSCISFKHDFQLSLRFQTTSSYLSSSVLDIISIIPIPSKAQSGGDILQLLVAFLFDSISFHTTLAAVGLYSLETYLPCQVTRFLKSLETLSIPQSLDIQLNPSRNSHSQGTASRKKREVLSFLHVAPQDILNMKIENRWWDTTRLC